MSTRGSDASRPPSRSKPAVISSSAAASRITSQDDALILSSQKRKRASPVFALEELLKPYITIKPQFCIGSDSVQPPVLKPLMLLPREHLALSALDLSAPNGEFPSGPGRFFESHIRVLDLEGRLRQAPSVLIARSDATRNVYAIERHQTGLYVVCKLGSWVAVEKLSHLAEACYEQRCRPTQAARGGVAEAPSTTPQLHHESKKKRLAIEQIQSMVRKRPRTVSTTTTPCESQQDQSQSQSRAVTPTVTLPLEDPFRAPPPEGGMSEPPPPYKSLQAAVADSNADMQTSAEDIFQNIRSQYLEALYHSKGSLAYFAKGPLSRARAAFHLDCDANLEMDDLVEFLKSLTVSTIQIDKKFRETLPELVKDIKLLAESCAEDEPRKKRRKPKKMKIGKDGLYPGEVDHVKRWWRTHQFLVRDRDEADLNPQEVKYYITCLRTRETQLQMILILEILALEALHPVQDARDSQLPGLPFGDTPKKTTEPTPKKRHKHNFSTLVDIHADRLCIWQSTTLDEMQMIAAESQVKDGSETHKPVRANSDPLKDFCVDILLPFFAGRLPELCESLNHKLGGPVVVSPPKPKKRLVSTAAKAAAVPGSLAKRPVPTSAPKSLDKIFSHDQLRRKASRRPTDVLARMRSATPATIPGLKREASEPAPLSAIPSGDKPLKERPRNVLSRNILNVTSEDSKAQKKAKMEADLKDAIMALKKPNRQLAGKALVEEAEKRIGSSSSPRPRKPKNPTRFSAGNRPQAQVQVKATPANYRFKDAVSTSDKRSYGSFNIAPPRHQLEEIPSSSIVPSTAPRNGLRDGLEAFHIASTPIANKVQANAVPDSAAPPRPNINDPFAQPSSPLMSKRAAPGPKTYLEVPSLDAAPSSPILPRLFATPVKQRPPSDTALINDTVTSTPPAPRHAATLFATPAKKAPTSAPPVVAEPTKSNEPSKITGLSIYQQLGWDDYDVDDLA
ncbi:hypothetical protein KVR01_005661 [Diaporthe batatas]|uniref:uncharacterized protein n=1 Tax=Diaporthe batatas TaxID=748121 RepID=UPI001D03A518|nr:uncharacterized protein KVR01_005661 [Diaporthe batatas]KAG8165386.1 hypothetical protein KVR01_005661 [Diaporthe batatas]